MLVWAEEFDKDKYALLKENKDMLLKVFDIDRGGEKPRKDLVYAQQIFAFIKYFFDETFEIEDEMPQEVVNAGDVSTIIEKYLETYDHSDDNETWFNKIRAITDELGYAVKPKDYKKHPEEYKGHVGHVSTVIRVALMGRQQSPDIWEIQQILGEERVRARLQKFI